MRTILRFSGLALLVAGLLAPAALAGKASEAAKPQSGSMKVDDKAGSFTSEGISAAEGKFDGVTFKARTHFTVATRGAVPEGKKSDFEAAKSDMPKLNALFCTWAHDLAKDRGEVGVFVLVYSRGDKLFVKAIADKASDVHRHLTDKDLSDLEKKLLTAFKAAKEQTGDEAKKTHDGGLMSATTFVIEQLEDTSLPAGKVTSDDHKNSSTGGMSIMGWVCIAGAVLLAIWVVVALIRMMTGGVTGYGGGGGGYGGGGGGGMGFMGGLMGGMFGAMAGMYLYDQFTGGHHYNDHYGNGNDGYDNSGGGNDSQDVGEGNFDGGSEGQGAGDWGDSGGDTGGDTGGGGDWGGGDTGGGGDWGGGGGDMGGGGDW